jgi:TPR repeat protein
LVLKSIGYWSYTSSMITWRVGVVSLVLLAACHRSGRPLPPESAATPIPLATLLSDCASASECEPKCAAGDARACVEAGRLCEFGHGQARDASRASGFYERSCTLGNASGCYNLAVLLETGRGVEKDPSRARGLYARVCQMGSKTACAHAETLDERSAQRL